MRYSLYVIAVCLFVCAAGCERVPQEEGTAADTAVTVTPAQASAEIEPAQPAEPAKPAETTPAVAPVPEAATTEYSTAAAPEAEVFVLATHGPDSNVCAAAQVERIAGEYGVQYVFGPQSSALYIDIAGLPRGAQPRTLAALAKVAALAPDATMVAFGTWQPSNLCALAVSPQQTYFFWGYGQDAHSDSTVTSGAWVHVAASYDGTGLVLYVNGVAERTARVALDTAASPLQLGGRRFQGALADVRVWPRVLPAEEIAALANETLAAARKACGEPEANEHTPAEAPAAEAQSAEAPAAEAQSAEAQSAEAQSAEAQGDEPQGDQSAEPAGAGE